MRLRLTVLAPVAAIALSAASLACFAVPSVHSFPIFPAKSADTPAPAAAAARQQQANQPVTVADLPVTIYDPQISDDMAAGLPEVIMAGQRRPNRAGQPETVYGDPSGQRATEISATHIAGSLPGTVYAGETGAAPSAGLPETVVAGSQMTSSQVTGSRRMHSVGQPETVYGGVDGSAAEAAQAPAENEAVPAADAAQQSARRSGSSHRHAGIAANPNGFGVETEPGHSAPPQLTTSPYTRLTDAQRVGENPCEIKNHQASPYSNLTDAQRAGQTNCF